MRRGGRDFDEGRPQQPVVQVVTLLEHLENLVRVAAFARGSRDGFVDVRVERTVGGDLRQPALLEGVGELAVDQRHSFAVFVVGRVAVGERALEIVEDRQDVAEEIREREAEIVRLLAFRPLLEVFEFRELSQLRVLELLDLALGGLELRAKPLLAGGQLLRLVLRKDLFERLRRGLDDDDVVLRRIFVAVPRIRTIPAIGHLWASLLRLPAPVWRKGSDPEILPAERPWDKTFEAIR